MKTRLVGKYDFIIIVAVVAAALIFIFGMSRSDDRLEAVVTVNGEVVEKIELDKIENEIEIIPDTVPSVVIKAERGAIYFYSAECNDKLCVKCGKLSKKGDTAVCLPSKTVITVTSNEVDAITY